MIFLATVFPPLAMILINRPGQFVLNVLLCVFGFWIAGIIHGVIIVNGHNNQKRQAEMLAAQREMFREQTAMLIANQMALNPLPMPPGNYEIPPPPEEPARPTRLWQDIPEDERPERAAP